MIVVHSVTRGWQDIGILLGGMGETQLPIRCLTEGCLVTSLMLSYRHFSKTYCRKEGSRERGVGTGGLLGGTGRCAVKSGPVKSGFIFPILRGHATSAESRRAGCRFSGCGTIPGYRRLSWTIRVDHNCRRAQVYSVTNRVPSVTAFVSPEISIPGFCVGWETNRVYPNWHR